MRLIDDFALTTALEKRIDEATNEDFAEGLCEALIEVHFAPTIDAVPVVHGRWKGAGMGDYMCSLCGFVVSGNGYRFCPNCGAKMDEEG